MSKIRNPQSLWKHCLGIFLSVAMIVTIVSMAGINVGATIYVQSAPSPGDVYFYAPETVYVRPENTGGALDVMGKPQYYVNNWSSGSKTGGGWENPAASWGRGEATQGYIHFYCEGATSVKLQVANDGGTGFYDGQTWTATGANLNATLASGANYNYDKLTQSGLVKWKATFVKNGVQYISYCYTYVYVPSATNVSGATARARNSMSVVFFDRQYVDNTSILLVSGTHKQDAISGVSTTGGGGLEKNESRFPSANLIRDVWNRNGASYNGNNIGTNDTAQNIYARASSEVSGSVRSIGMAYGGDANIISWDSQVYIRGGKAYLAVDTSRYNNLSQIPQLRSMFAQIYFSAGGSIKHSSRNAWMKSAYNPASPDTTQAVGNAMSFNNRGVGFEGAINYPLSNASNTVEVQGRLNLKTKRSGAVADITNDHRIYTVIELSRYNKINLRTKLQEEIQSGIQWENMNNADRYGGAMDNLAMALCNPAHSFKNSAGADTSNTDLGRDDEGGSLANLVFTARDRLSQSGPYTATATYRSSVKTAADGSNIVANESVSRLYYKGDNVYAKYQGNLVHRGYRSKPIAVTPPGDFKYDDSEITYFGSATKRYDIDSQTVLNRDGTVFQSGLAPNSDDDPINLNTGASDLEWIWWLAPIDYTLRYVGGDHAAPGQSNIDVLVKYDTPTTLLSCTFTPQAGWVFSHWDVSGLGDKKQGDTVKNLSEDDEGIVVVKAVWKEAAPEDLTLVFDPNGGTPGALQYVACTSGETYDKYIPLIQDPEKTGYSFAGWFFDLNSAARPLNRYGASKISESPGLTLYAHWTPTSSKITYEKATGSTGNTPAEQTVLYDTSVTLNDGAGLAFTGYTFLGWFPDVYKAPGPEPLTSDEEFSKLLVAGGTYTHNEMFAGQVEGRVTLYPVWQANEYSIRFENNWHNPDANIEGDNSPPAEPYAVQGVTYGQEYGEQGWPTDPERFGWAFVGWYPVATSSSGANVISSTVFEPTKAALEANGGVITLYARWLHGMQLPKTLILEPVGGTFPDGSTGNRPVIAGLGEKVNLTNYTPTKQGYSFEGWEITNGDTSLLSADNVTSITINEDTTLRAMWEPIYYTVVFNSNYPATAENPTPAQDLEELVGLTVDGGVISLPAAGTFTFPGRSLQGYAYNPTDTLPAILPGTNNLTLAQLLTGAGIADGDKTNTVINLYGLWKINGGIPDDPEEEFPGLPTDPGEEPPPGPDYPGIPDPDGGDGYIVMYFIVPKDVVVPGGTPGYRFLTYGKSYGAMPMAQKTDGINMQWKVIKYGSAGRNMPPLGDTIAASDKVDHEYSIWVAPFFDPGYAIKYVGNGGTIVDEGTTNTSRIVFPEKTYGESPGGMPEAEREFYRFLGWFTQPEGGTQITSETQVGPEGQPVAQGTLTSVDNLPVVDVLYAQWEQTASDWDIFIAGLPDWVVNVFLGIGLGALGYGSASAGTLAALGIGTIIGASIIGFFLLPLALLLPFVFPVVGALMPIWWPLLLI